LIHNKFTFSPSFLSRFLPTFFPAVINPFKPNLQNAQAYLIPEQNGLCTYCQQKIEIENSSMEHLTPKEHNKELSTS
jgi:hypothetical protein